MFVLSTFCVRAQEPIRLWAGDAPGALGKEDKDVPTLTPYLPDPARATGAAIVICPGGGYSALAQHEGKDYALFLNEQGVAGLVLKYRLGSNGYRHPAMLEDAARAVRLVRARAAEWKVDPKRVGIMGSSAGGHLASTLLTHFDPGKPDSADPVERESSRPDLGILCYAVISMLPPNVHTGSRDRLLGKDPPEELLKLLSNDLRVTPQTPPCFIWHTWEDKAVKLEPILELCVKLKSHARPYELHVYETGRHGLGLGVRPYEPTKTLHPWTVECRRWLAAQGF